MANKVIAIKVDLQGTQEQQKKLAKLESEVKKLTLRRTELNKALKKGTIGLKEYGQKIAQVNTKLKANRREMLVARENILGLDSFTKKLGKSFARLGTNIGGAFVGLFAIQKLGQLVSSAVTTIKDFEQQMANVKAVTGATAIEFQKLEQSAKDLGATTQFTASEVGKLQEEYAKLGFTTDQILDASEATLELATATGSDLAQSAKVAAATINGFGLEAKDTQKIVDVMAKSFTSSALDLNKFETAMSSVAPVAKATGFSLEETTASLGVLVDAGFDASTAGTALRNILLDTTKAGLTTSEAFDMIKGSVDPSSTSLDLFGKRGAAVALTLANSTDKTNKFTKALKNSAGSAEAMAKIVGDTLEGDVKKLNSAWEGLILNLGENGEDAFRSIVQGATDLISTLGGLTENIHAGSDAMREQQVAVNTLASRALKLNEGDEDRIKLLNEINVINPDVLKGLDLQTLSNEQLTTALKASNKEMINKIILERELEKVQAKREDVADDLQDVVDKEIELETLLSAKKIANKELLAQEDTRYNKLSKSFAKQQLKILEDETLSVNQQVSALFALESQRSRLSDETREALALTVQIRRANEGLKESEQDLTEATEKREALEKRLGLNQAENNKVIDSNIDLTKLSIKELEKLNNAEARAEIARRKTIESNKNLGYSLEFINQELEELNDDALDDDSFDLDAINLKTSAIEAFTKMVKDEEQKMSDINEKEADNRVESTAKEIQSKLELKTEEAQQQLEFEKEVLNQKIGIAEQGAQALLEISNRKFKRENDLELAALDAKLQQGLISQEDFEKEREAIERKAFKRQKRLELAQVAISLATEIASIAAASAGNPLNAFTAGVAGAAQNKVLAGIAIARSAVQAGVIASQSFADGGFTGNGFGSADATGFKQAGVVHENEYVVPKNVLESQRGGQLVNALESMRMNKPQPSIGIGFANGGFTSGSGSVNMVDLENRITKAVTNSIGAIQVVNNATDTVSEAVKVNNIVTEATFG